MPSRSGLTSLFNSNFYKNNHDIFHLISKRKWKKVRQFFNSISNPSDALSSLPEVGNGQNVLHALCSKEPPIDIVKMIIEASPLCPIEVDDQKRTPLHTAAASLAPEDVIKLLASVYPETAAAKDIEGKTPLMLACDQCKSLYIPTAHLDEAELLCNQIYELRHWPPELINTLIVASPRTVADEDNAGMSALEYAIASEAPSYIIQALQYACRDECLRQRAESQKMAGQASLVQGMARSLLSSSRKGEDPLSPHSSQCGIPYIVGTAKGRFLTRMSALSIS